MSSNRSPFPITGMGSFSPAKNGTHSLWEACLGQNTLINAGLARIETSTLEKAWEKISQSPWIKKHPTLISRSMIFTLSSLIEAIDSAEWKSFTNEDVIFIGTTSGQISLWETELIQRLKINPDQLPDENKLAKHCFQSLANDLKEILNFPGKIIILSSACSASTQAIIAAHDYLSSRRAKRCLAGGVEELSNLTITGFNCLKLLSPEPCKPFDQSRIGINLSEGAAFYAIENHSEKKPLAYLYAGETVLDSYHMTSPNPEGAGLQKALQHTLKKNHIDSNDISMVHAHGTGSIQNDMAESSAISKIFSHSPPVISTKGIHGHSLGASGAMELEICLQILNKNTIPPVAGLKNTDEQITLNLPKEMVKQEIRFLAKTTLGFGGVNSTFIIGKEKHA